MSEIEEDELDDAGTTEEGEAIEEPGTEAIEQTEAVVDEPEIEDEVVIETTSYSGSDSFVVFIRHEDKVLLMRRGDNQPDFPGAWDGIYGVNDPTDIDAVTARIEASTGISAANLTYVRSAAPRGLDFGGRLNDVTPILFMSATTEVEPRSTYTEAEWCDPGSIGDKSDSIPQIGELYGDVASYLYILKTTMGQEQKVASEIQARLSGTGSLQDIQGEIFGVLCAPMLRGFVFVEASALHHVEKLIGRAGGRTTPLKNCRKVLPGTSPLGDVTPYLEPKAATAGIEEGDIVEIRVSSFKGQRARVTNIAENKEEVTVELFDALIPIPVTIRADQVRVIQRVDE